MSDRFAPSAEWLSVHRIFYCFFLGFQFRSISWVVDLPTALYSPPPGLMQLFGGFPDKPFAFGLMTAFWLALVFILVGAWVRPASIVLALAALTMMGFADAMEKVHHRGLVFMAAPFLAWGGWDRRWAAQQHAEGDESAERPFRLLAIFVGAVFLSSALSKLSGGWLSLESQAARAHVVTREMASVMHGPLAEWAHHGSSQLWELADWATILFQVGVFTCAFSPRWFRRALLLACCFHLGMYLLLRVSFWDFALVYVAFIPNRRAAGISFTSAQAQQP